MANNPIEDRYNPPGLKVEFEKFKFADINVDELVWFSDNANPNKNNAFRKINESQAQNTKTREIINVNYKVQSYQKI